MGLLGFHQPSGLRPFIDSAKVFVKGGWVTAIQTVERDSLNLVFDAPHSPFFHAALDESGDTSNHSQDNSVTKNTFHRMPPVVTGCGRCGKKAGVFAAYVA